MGNFLLSFMSVTCFCFCCHYFISAIVKPQPALNRTGYTRAALRLKQGYKIFALGTMTFVFLIGLVVSFYQVYVQI